VGKSPRIRRRGKRFLQSLSFPKSVLWRTSSASQLLYLSVSPCKQSKPFFFFFGNWAFYGFLSFCREVFVWVIWFLFLLIVILAKRSTYLHLIDISFLLCHCFVFLYKPICKCPFQVNFSILSKPFFFGFVSHWRTSSSFFFLFFLLLLSFGPPWVCYI